MSIVIVSRCALSTMGTYRMRSQNGNEKRNAITIQIKKTWLQLHIIWQTSKEVSMRTFRYICVPLYRGTKGSHS